MRPARQTLRHRVQVLQSKRLHSIKAPALGSRSHELRNGAACRGPADGSARGISILGLRADAPCSRDGPGPDRCTVRRAQRFGRGAVRGQGSGWPPFPPGGGRQPDCSSPRPTGDHQYPRTPPGTTRSTAPATPLRSFAREARDAGIQNENLARLRRTDPDTGRLFTVTVTVTFAEALVRPELMSEPGRATEAYSPAEHTQGRMDLSGALLTGTSGFDPDKCPLPRHPRSSPAAPRPGCRTSWPCAKDRSKTRKRPFAGAPQKSWSRHRAQGAGGRGGCPPGSFTRPP